MEGFMVAVLDFYTPIKDFIDMVAKRGAAKETAVGEALTALREAILATKEYEERSGGQKCFDREAEYQLSRLWGTASDKARKANNDLAIRLNLKVSYWSDVRQWTPAEVSAHRISLASFEDEIEKLLGA
jgi:hypothetical protein